MYDIISIFEVYKLFMNEIPSSTMEMKHAQFIHCVKKMTNKSNRSLMECVVKGYVVNEAIWGRTNDVPNQHNVIASNASLRRDFNDFNKATSDILKIVGKYGCLAEFNRMISTADFRNAIAVGNNVDKQNAGRREQLVMESIMTKQMQYMAFLESLRNEATTDAINVLMNAYALTESQYSINFIPMFEATVATFDDAVLTPEEYADEDALKKAVDTIANFIKQHGTHFWNDFLSSAPWMRLKQSLQNDNNEWHP